ncbi:MAG: hypothetical protein WCD21_16790 [Streptomyces sp.]
MAVAAIGAVIASQSTAQAALAAPAAKVVHAAPHGSGKSCTAARPCSPQVARDAARTIGGRDVRVELSGGTYELREPLALGTVDSGRDGHTVTWTAAPS